MSTISWKNIHMCVPKFKCLPTYLSPPPVNEADDAAQINNNNAAAAAAALIKNFNSIYDTSANSVSTGSKSAPFSSTEDHRPFFFSSSSYSSDNDDDDDDDDSSDYNLECSTPPDFSTVFASQRFFFSSPGNSNSIIDNCSQPPPEIIKPTLPPLPPPPSPPARDVVVVESDDGCKSVSSGEGFGVGVVAVQTYSPDPYADFRKSMQEMVEAHELRDLKADWDYLHELLLCYLSLNPKNTHKLIIGAFIDLIVSLTSTSSNPNPNPNPGHRKTDVNNHRCTTSTT